MINSSVALAVSDAVHVNCDLGVGPYTYDEVNKMTSISRDALVKNRVNAMSQCPPAPPIPQRTDLSESIPEPERIDALQRYIEAFDYNYTGKPFLEMKRNRGAAHIQSCSLQIISAALPIQCVEAVFLGCWLTAQMTNVDRIPLSFKSNFRLLI